MQVTILGKRYELRFTRLRGAYGECDAPTDPDKGIRISTGLSEKEELETVIHELLHAACWWLCEEWVTRTAEDIATVLWRLGWRKSPVGGD